MAAYAALVSLTNLMEDIHSHPRLSTSLDKKQIESLGQNVDSLLDFIENYRSDAGSKEVAEDLERQIASSAHAAEDVIESFIVDQIHDGISNENNFRFSLDLQKVIEGMDYVKEKAMEIEEERGFKHKRFKCFAPAASSTPLITTQKTRMVGADDELALLMDALTRRQSSREIITIIGMGGMGKTALTQIAYEDKAIVRHFDLCAWATISQEYNVREILLQLLSQKPESSSEPFDELGEKLHKMLSGRRYLIVLDDMWSEQVWDKIKFYFPDNGNESRVLITSRLSKMDIPICSSPIKMKLLDEHKSWELFCQKAYGEEDCPPPELEEIGKKIVKKCKGLPLPIVVIGRHLGKSSRTKEYWESVANDMNSILDSEEEDEQCLAILSLSYTHLPAHLKPCFLYMGMYAEDQAIHVPYLVNKWVAERFLKPIKAQNLENVAMAHLKDLIDRNLILVHSLGHLGEIGYVKIHDLVREMCIKVAKKEKFFCALDTPRTIPAERRVVLSENIREEKHHPKILHSLRSAPLLRSLVCEGGGELPFIIKLLKVLNRVEVADNGGLDANFQRVNLRYLFCTVLHPTNDHQPNSIHLPPSISLLWNLQTLIIRGPFLKLFAPPEIWNMPHLRYLEFSRIYLPDPPPSDGAIVLQNLHTLLGVVNLKLSAEVCRRIPNIKQLEVEYHQSDEASSSYYCSNNLGLLHKLELLKCFFSGKQKYWYALARSLTFPNRLRQLTLINCPLRWEDLTMMGRLPLLTDLTLICSAMGREWDVVEGEFRCLKSLSISGCSGLVSWNANSSHFPVLENLSIGGACSLDEIPLDIGEIETLRCMNVHSCSMSAMVSAVRIMVEQEELGNEDILLELWFVDATEKESFTKLVEEEGLTCDNPRVVLQ